MPIGLYRDLAVGADAGGSEIWAHPDRYAATLSVGAPPDPLGPLGQNWGLPPFNPLALERQITPEVNGVPDTLADRSTVPVQD